MKSSLFFKLTVLFYYLKTKYFLSFRNRKSLEHYQQKKLSNFLKWVQKNSSFYRENGLKIIDKSIMMEHFSELNTKNINREAAFKIAEDAENSRDFNPTLKGVTVGLSSGTSGNRGLFLASDHERALYAGTIIAKLLPNSLFSINRVAFFMRANSNLYTATKSSRLQFKFFELFTPLEEQVDSLNLYQPTILIAPPSALLKCAELKTKNQLNIQPLKIVSVAETLDPLDQKNLETVFDQKIHQVYQCTEGFLGITCQEGTLHLNEDLIYFEKEWLNLEKTKFQPILSDFTRTTQPILRYRLNDILTIKEEPCRCGSALTALSMIEGRMDDCLEFLPLKPSPKNILIFPDFIRRSLILSSDEISEYYVLQKNPGALEITLQFKRTLSLNVENLIKEKIIQEITKVAQTQNAQPPLCIWTKVVPLFHQKKRRRVHRIYDKKSYDHHPIP